MSLFTPQEQDRIAEAIATAEKNTSGEIRIALEKHCKIDPLERATQYFFELEMHKTHQRNGVLIYLAYHDKKFAVIGDKGINQLVPENFWETVQIALKAHFSSGNIADGIIAGVSLAGEKLALYFPSVKEDINELPNEIIYIDQKKKK